MILTAAPTSHGKDYWRNNERVLNMTATKR